MVLRALLQIRTRWLGLEVVLGFRVSGLGFRVSKNEQGSEQQPRHPGVYGFPTRFLKIVFNFCYLES